MHASITQRDLEFESEIKRNPYSIRTWLQYLEVKEHAEPRVRFILYERCLKFLPMSYKVWYRYLNERVDFCRDECIDNICYEETNNVMERSLTFMHKMPRIWMIYGEFLTYQRFTTRTRRMFDNALRSLPITQHARIWPLYLKFVRQINVPETAVRVYRRFVMLQPECREEFIDYFMENVKSLKKREKRQGLDDFSEERKNSFLREAAMLYIDIVNDDSFSSKKGKNKMKLWKELCDILCNHPAACTDINVDAILRSGIRRYPDQIGWLWCQLAKYYIRLSQFERARDVFEEAITTVATCRDFEIAFDGYVKFEEGVIMVKSEVLDEDEEDDLDLRIERLECLAERQKILLSSVKLRQNPHNVDEWIARVKIFTDCEPPNITKAFETFSQAIKTIDPQQATGRPHQIWVMFARFYEEYSSDVESALEDAREVFKKAVQVNYRSVDDLASVYCEWGEMLLRHKRYTEAQEVLQEAVKIPDDDVVKMPVAESQKAKVQDRLFKSTKLWSFRADLEESIGTLDSVKEVYDSFVDLKVINPQGLLNYADYLHKLNFFEESFRVFEKGVAIFSHPHVMPIWRTYLKSFLTRYQGKKMERMREIFEQSLKDCPPKSSKEFFLLYARTEEQFGLARHAMKVYDKAVDCVTDEDKMELYSIYIQRAGDLFGVTRTREIYIKAIKTLPDIYLPNMCLRFVALERRLGEVDRAREIFKYGSQYTDPKAHVDYWEEWQNFELENGNEETYKEMRRIKRSVESTFTSVRTVLTEAPPKPNDEMEALDQTNREPHEFAEEVDMRAEGQVPDENEIQLGKLMEVEIEETAMPKGVTLTKEGARSRLMQYKDGS